ncbi:MAG: glucose-1-phosphate thymidylyltransferase [Thermoprotei archaeon]|nr:MAG: glucose-1-phosphate thymidylyltransferase [Thermoprotei archaeon]
MHSLVKKAVVLAAGKGTRLNPITLTRPKHMLPVAGKPVIEWILSSLKSVGIEEVGIVVHFHEEILREFLSSKTELELKIEYIHQRELTGTATAVETAEEFTEGEPFIVVNGDVLFPPHVLRKLIEECIDVDAGLVGVRVEEPWKYGVLQVENGFLKGIVEKPERGKEPSNLINAGIYFFRENIFKYIKHVRPSPRGERELTDALTMMANKCSIRVVEGNPEWWFDVGVAWILLDANMFYFKEMYRSNILEGDIDKGVYIHSPVHIHEGSIIRGGTIIKGPVYIGSNVSIGRRCVIGPYTTICDGVTIGSMTYISRSIIMEDTEILNHCSIFESILGSHCSLESGVKLPALNIYGGTIKVLIKDKIVDSGRMYLGAILGDEVKVCANTAVPPGTIIQPRTIVR